MGERSQGNVVYVTGSDEKARMVTDRLSAQGSLSVRPVTTVNEAMAVVDDGPVDCIVTDHDLPDIDSITFLEMIRGQFPDLPFIIFTTQGSERMASRAIAAGATDYLIEDEEVQWSTLAGRIENAVDYYREQAELVKSEARAPTVLEASPDAVCVVRGDTIVYVNQVATELFGVDDPSALRDRALFELIHPDDNDRVTDRLDAVREGTRRVDQLRATTTSPDGAAIPAELSISHVQWKRQPALIIVIRDLRDQVGKRRLFRRFHRAVNAAGHAVFITETDGTIIYVNPAFERITGYTAAEAINETPRILRSGHHDDTFYENLWETILAGDVWEDEVVNTRKDGEKYHAHQTVAPVTDRNGDSSEFIAIQTDVTDRKERTKQLQVLSRILRHNVHNEMSVILGSAELIEENLDASSELASATARIQERANRLVETADKERDIVELFSEQRRVEPIDLESRVEATVGRLRQRHPAADIDVTSRGEVTVTALDDIDVAIAELAENAIVHNDRQHPAVAVELTRAAGTVTVRVADDGPSIPAAERDVLTHEGTIEPLYHGSGLGLWLISWIVKYSGGRLRFGENDPRGNVVTIELDPASDGV